MFGIRNNRNLYVDGLSQHITVNGNSNGNMVGVGTSLKSYKLHRKTAKISTKLHLERDGIFSGSYSNSIGAGSLWKRSRSRNIRWDCSSSSSSSSSSRYPCHPLLLSSNDNDGTNYYDDDDDDDDENETSSKEDEDEYIDEDEDDDTNFETARSNLERLLQSSSPSSKPKPKPKPKPKFKPKTNNLNPPKSKSSPLTFGPSGRSAPSQRKAMGTSGSSTTTVNVCTNCSAEFVKWIGRCPTCKEWNTVQEFQVRRGITPPGFKSTAKPALSSWLTGVDGDVDVDG